VLPRDWGRTNPGPRTYPLLEAGEAVRDRYLPLGKSKQLSEIFETAKRLGASRVYLDSPYVDFDYRSDLAHFYARAFRPPPPNAERLLFADDRRILGSCVLRPLVQPVGRTIMTPPPEAAPYICCKTDSVIHAFGGSWTIEGFPFTSQDGEYGVCAHAAIWAIARYHHLRFHTDRHTISSIIDAAGLRERTDRTMRSEGLYANEILRAFSGIGLPALNYWIEDIPAPESPERLACRYLNSGIPVGVLSDEHMMVLNGYGENPDGTIFYFLSDDNSHAYQRVEKRPEKSEQGAWRMFVIPLPGRLHVIGGAAETRAEEVLEDRMRADHGPSHLRELWNNDGLRHRTYATPAADYEGRLAARGVPDAIRNHHLYAPKSGWLWITEFQDPDRAPEERVVGEIAVDATSQQLNPSPLFGNLGGWAYLWHENEQEPLSIELCAGGAAYSSALADRSVPRPTFDVPDWSTDWTPEQIA
jgi:hypothetical protein